MKFRYQLQFYKKSRLRFIGHLDLQKMLEIAFRRCGLPFARSEGFHPHLLYSVACPLPLGVESQVEWLEIYLSFPTSESEILSCLNAVLPEDLKIISVYPEKLESPALMALMRSVVYEIKLENPHAAKDNLNLFESSQNWLVKRTDKEIDLKPRIQKWEWLSDSTLALQCQANEQGGVRLNELLDLLAVTDTFPEIWRTQLIFEEEAQFRLQKKVEDSKVTLTTH